MESTAQSVDEVVEEIMRIHRSLPERPGIDEVEAAKALIQNVEKEDQARLDAIARQNKGAAVPEELFKVLQEMQRNLVYFQSKEQKLEAMKLLDLENTHVLFDEFIQRASNCVSSNSASSSSNSQIPKYSNGSVSTVTGTSLNKASSPASTYGGVRNNSSTSSSSSLYLSEKAPEKNGQFFSRDDSYVKKSKASFYTDGVGAGHGLSPKPLILDSTLKPATASGQDGDKLSLIKLASLIEVSKKKGTKDLNLQGKLMDQIEWLPDSIGKLSSLVSLDLSENRIVALPATIGGLFSLTKLDLHSNRLAELPESIGDLLSLVFLDLRSNQLAALPATIGKLVRLEELDVSSNRLSLIPESIASLMSLKKLNLETNDIEEIPHTVGQCQSLKELRVDYNRLKALPEAVGKIGTLEVLSVRYNNIKQLPTTMSSLFSLRELDVSFNEVESVPESLCFATTLVKLNLGNNFANMRSLPRSIGNLEMLQELDISNNQIRVLPDSFRMLTQLQVLRAEENPLEVPPRHIAEKGAQAVVEYMNELVMKRDAKAAAPVKQKKTWAQICFFSRSNKRKRSGVDYVKT